MMRLLCKRQLLVMLAFLFVVPTCAANDMKEAQKVRALIARVNNYWQSQHAPESRAFWDNAAYHTGNMEAYFLTRNEKYKEYSEAWARHNQWQGAKGTDRSRWRYDYGENDDHVLFGDWLSF